MKFSDKSTSSIAEAVKLVLEGKNIKKEEMDPTDHVSEKDGKYIVVDKDGKEVKSFDDREDANKYAVDNHSKLMGKVEESADLEEMKMGDVEKKLAKVKGLSKETMAQLTALPMPVLTSMVNQLSTIMASCKEEADINEALLDFVAEAKKYKLSRKEEAAILLLLTKSKTDKEAAKKLEKEMKVSAKDAAAMVKQVMVQYESLIEDADQDIEEAKFVDNDLVHIAKANVRGNNNPKTDKIIGYSKAPKNPNKFPNPKSGANAIMRIGDAKKKGFKIESAELNDDVVESVVISEEDKQAKYQAFFKKAMKKFGISNIADLKGAKKKEFFDYVDANYEAEGEVDEVAEPEAEGEKKFKALHKVKVSGEVDEVAEPEAEGEKKFKALHKVKVSEETSEEVTLDENLVIGGQFKAGDMPNSDLHTSIEALKAAKKKAEAQKPKVSDPVLVKSLDDVISQVDKAIKDAEKTQAAVSKAIAKVSPSIKKTFDLLKKKKYLVTSFEAEGDTIEEAVDIDELHTEALMLEEIDALHGQAIVAELLEAVPSTVVVFEAPFALFSKEAGSFFFNLPTKYKVAKVADSNDRHVAIAGEPKNLEKMLKDPIFDGKLDVEAIMKDAVKFTGKERFPREKGKNFKN